jgi:hypothetical protein
VELTRVPEPASAGLMMTAATALICLRRRRRRRLRPRASRLPDPAAKPL